MGKNQADSKMLRSSSRNSWSSWLGVGTSMLCLIHCFATVIVASLAPGFLKFLPHNLILESIIWCFSSAFAFHAMWRIHINRMAYIPFFALFATGMWTIFLHNHTGLFYCFMGLAAFQLVLVFFHFFPHHHHHDHQHACCQSGPGKQKKE